MTLCMVRWRPLDETIPTLDYGNSLCKVIGLLLKMGKFH